MALGPIRLVKFNKRTMAALKQHDGSAAGAAKHVVLVHGFTRSRYDMALLAPRLRRLLPHSVVHVFGYSSRTYTIEQAAKHLGEFVGTISSGDSVSFVGHSLGGLIVRALDLSGEAPAPLSRLVTLGTPHQGSLVAQKISKLPLLRSLGGPVLEQLAAPRISPQPVQLEIGCVIGASNSRFGFLPILRGDNDGLVRVEEAVLPACVAEVKIPVFHGFFPFSSQVADLAARFLAHGTFSA